MIRLIESFIRDERGGISVEYAIICGLLGVVTALGATALGDAMDNMVEPATKIAGPSQSIDTAPAL
jgi:Flp pilus assembly pilin Flp